MTPQTLRKRRRLRQPVHFSGRGLFSAQPASVNISPAVVGPGIRFLRTDLPNATPILATSDALSIKPEHTGFPAALRGRNTTIADDRSSIATIEHLMSALAAFGIDDALVQIDGPEVPILDGSALRIAELIEQAWYVEDRQPIEPIELRETLRVDDPASGAFIVAEPCFDPLPTYTYELDYTGSAAAPFPPQSAAWNPPIGGGPDVQIWDSTRNYILGIAPARTYSLEHEAKAMQAAGLFRHLTTRDMLVYDAQGKPIDNSARFDDEPARHKLLDLIGDLALLGRPLRADVRASRSGHALTHELVRRLRALA